MVFGLIMLIAWLQAKISRVDQETKYKSEHVLTVTQTNVRPQTENAVFGVEKPEHPYQTVLVSILK